MLSKILSSAIMRRLPFHNVPYDMIRGLLVLEKDIIHADQELLTLLA